jgi:hypothetical protein
MIYWITWHTQGGLGMIYWITWHTQVKFE